MLQIAIETVGNTSPFLNVFNDDYLQYGGKLMRTRHIDLWLF